MWSDILRDYNPHKNIADELGQDENEKTEDQE